MKKNLKVILSVMGVIILSIALDIASILLINKPIFAIKENCKCNYPIYRGLFYDTYNCPEYPMAQIKLKGTEYSCAIAPSIKEDFIIIDESEACDQELEEIYDDSYNKYYLPCLKSERVYLKFDSGKKFKIKEALEKGYASINDILNKNYNIIIKPQFNLEVNLKDE